MNRLSLFVLGGALLAGCASVDTSVRAGYLQLEVSGDVALATGSSNPSAATEQDIGSGFGLGDERGTPFVRADFDLGWPTLTVSGFWFRDRGEGVLEATFGGLAQATSVSSEIELGCLKLGAVYDIDIGPVTLSPGLAVDVFDFDFRASDSPGNSEVIDEVLAVPMLVARGEARLGPAELIAEIGYIEGSSANDSTSRFLDAEVMLACAVSKSVFVFAGYRLIDVDANGDTESQSFQVDLALRGWCIGGGIAF